MSTFREMLQTARSYLIEHEVADATVDTWYLLTSVFGISKAQYFLREQEQVPEEDGKRFMELVELRAKHIPLQHITGTQEFMGMEFDVTGDVLIPRQDTEILVEEVRKVCRDKTVLDMCTGSGCIIISLAALGNIKSAAGADLSSKALEVAAANVRKHNVDVTLIQSDLFENIKGIYDIIVSNPPYIPTDEIAHLMPEVREHEPWIALDGDCDGLSFYRRITAGLKEHLRRGGMIFYEIGCNQGKEVSQILQNAGFYDIHIKKDLCGLDRVVYGKRAAGPA